MKIISVRIEAFQTENIFKIKRKYSIFQKKKKMLFTENSETNIGHLHSLFFVVAADEAFFYKLL